MFKQHLGVQNEPDRLVTRGRLEELIEIGVDDPSQLFDCFDRSPLDRRHLDAKIDRLIVHLAEERMATRYLLFVRIREGALAPSDEPALAAAIQNHFAHRAHEAAGKLRILVANGKRDLVIGLILSSSSYAERSGC